MRLALVVLVALAAAGLAAALMLRLRRRRACAQAVMADDPDFEPRFPEGPDDRPARETAPGRRIAGR